MWDGRIGLDGWDGAPGRVKCRVPYSAKNNNCFLFLALISSYIDTKLNPTRSLSGFLCLQVLIVVAQWPTISTAHGTVHSDSKAQGTQDTISTVRGTEHPSTATETADVTKVQFRMLLQPTIGVDFFKVNMNKVEVGQDLDIVTSIMKPYKVLLHVLHVVAMCRAKVDKCECKE